eukprot:7634-Heterococcus_DN1.PRE.1
MTAEHTPVCYKIHAIVSSTCETASVVVTTGMAADLMPVIGSSTAVAAAVVDGVGVVAVALCSLSLS